MNPGAPVYQRNDVFVLHNNDKSCVAEHKKFYHKQKIQTQRLPTHLVSDTPIRSVRLLSPQ